MNKPKITAKEVRLTSNRIERGRKALAYHIQSGHECDQERYQFIAEAFTLLEARAKLAEIRAAVRPLETKETT
jgi:hypothetical protein